MGKASPAIANFNGGEWAPEMLGRVDTEKYPIACVVQQNFIATKQGASTFRAGTFYAQQVKNSAQRTWVRRFEFSQTQAFVIEFGGNYCRFYTNHGPLLYPVASAPAWGSGTAYAVQAVVSYSGVVYYCTAANTGQNPSTVGSTYWAAMAPYAPAPSYAIYESWSPYASADLTDGQGRFALQLRQQGDVVYIAGGYAGTGYPPYMLTRVSNSPPQWTFAQYAPVDGPFSPASPLVPNKNIALTVSAAQGIGITINAYGGSPFAATDIGRLVRIGAQSFNYQPWEAGLNVASGQIVTNNGNNYRQAFGTTCGSNAPIHTSGAASDGAVYWVYIDSGYGIAQITGYTSGSQVIANVLLAFPYSVVGYTAPITAIGQGVSPTITATNTFPVTPLVGSGFIVGAGGMTQINQQPLSIYQNGIGIAVIAVGLDSTTFSAYTSGGTVVWGATTEWQLGAWSATTEWPRAVGMFKDRLWWLGKFNAWGSVPALYNSHAQDFFGQVTTDCAINILISGADASQGCWMQDAITLLVGTEGGEYAIDAANTSAPMGPANVECLAQSQWRCAHIDALKIGNTVLYWQRAGRKLEAMDYTLWLNRYDSTDQQKFAFHITYGGIVGHAFQAEPWSVIWAWRADGTLLSYTYNREDQVQAWCRHNMGAGGIVESMCVIPAPDGTRDEYWAVVNRTVNGAVIRTVEYSAKQFEGPRGGSPGDAQPSAVYLDCAVQVSQLPSVAITNVTSFWNGVRGTGSTTYTAANNFSVGQLVYVQGIQYSGTFNPNVQGVAITAANASSFTIAQNVGNGTFSYQSGGLAGLGSNITTQTLSGLPPVMWNQTVGIFADGGAQPQQVVSATGTLTLSRSFGLVTVGFPYQGNIVPNRFEGGADVGTAQGKKKNGTAMAIRLIDSMGGALGQLSNTNLTTGAYQDPGGLVQQNLRAQEPIQYNMTQTGLDMPPPLQSGDFPVSFPQVDVSVQDQTDFLVLYQQNLPYPTTVAGLFPSYEVQEPR